MPNFPAGFAKFAPQRASHAAMVNDRKPVSLRSASCTPQDECLATALSTVISRGTQFSAAYYKVCFAWLFFCSDGLSRLFQEYPAITGSFLQ